MSFAYSDYEWLDNELSQLGYHKSSPAWCEAFREYCDSGKFILLVRGGRRSGKSVHLSRLVLAYILSESYVVPRSEYYYCPFLSSSKEEARTRLHLLDGMLTDLGVEHKTTQEEIDIPDYRTKIVVLAAARAAVIGRSCPIAVGDELAAWSSEGAEPAESVIAALKPCMASVPGAKLLLSSSPWGIDDYHASICDKGSDASTHYVNGPSWFWNPTLSEEATHQLESDDREWERQYKAIPMQSKSDCFDAKAVAHAYRDLGLNDSWRPADAVVLCDPSGGKHDAWTFCVARYWTNDAKKYWMKGPGRPWLDGDGNPRVRSDYKEEPPILVISEVGGFEGAFFGVITMDDIANRVTHLAKSVSTTQIHADSYAALGNESDFGKRGMSYHAHSWNTEEKAESVRRLKRWLSDGLVVIAPIGKTPEGRPIFSEAAQKMRAELLSYEENTNNGRKTFGGKRGRFDDYVSLLLLAAHHEVEGSISRSALRGNRYVGIVNSPLPGVYGCST